MFRGWKYVLVAVILVTALASFVPQASACCGWRGCGWGWGCGWGCGWYGGCGCGCYSPCYTSCYSCYTPCCNTCAVGCTPYRCGSGCYGYGWGSCGCYNNCSSWCGGSNGCCGGSGTVVPLTPTPATTMPAPATPTPATKPAPTTTPTVPAPTLNPTSLNTLDNSGLMTIWVPAEAKVTINGLATRSIGSRRQYVSFGLKPGFNYKYAVHAEIVRDGKIVEEDKTVTLTAGQQTGVAFGFNAKTTEGLASN